MTDTNHKRETAGDRKRQREAERARIKAENEPIHLKPNEPFQQQMSERAARTTPLASMHNKGGKEHAKLVEEQRRPTVAELRGRVVRPPAEGPEHRHSHGYSR